MVKMEFRPKKALMISLKKLLMNAENEKGLLLSLDMQATSVKDWVGAKVVLQKARAKPAREPYGSGFSRY